jgi:hypothetical protein
VTGVNVSVRGLGRSGVSNPSQILLCIATSAGGQKQPEDIGYPMVPKEYDFLFKVQNMPITTVI